MSQYVAYKVIRNIKFPVFYENKNIEYAFDYKVRPNDRFVVTYPKAGTTWAQQIIALIVNDGVIDNMDYPVKSYLEFSGEDTITEPVIKTHLPFDIIPFNPSAKYLLVFRNPKDSCVSFYHMTDRLHPECNVDFHTYFQFWIKGEQPYGDYFEHTLEYWKHRSDNNFQFLIYEEMKRNPKEAVLKIAQLLGQEFLDKLKNDETMLKKIIENSSINSMKSNFDTMNPDDTKLFIRKGEVGDWKNHMTKEESDLIDDKVLKMFANTGLDTIWADYIKW